MIFGLTDLLRHQHKSIRPMKRYIKSSNNNNYVPQSTYRTIKPMLWPSPEGVSITEGILYSLTEVTINEELKPFKYRLRVMKQHSQFQKSISLLGEKRLALHSVQCADNLQHKCTYQRSYWTNTSFDNVFDNVKCLML